MFRATAGPGRFQARNLTDSDLKSILVAAIRAKFKYTASLYGQQQIQESTGTGPARQGRRGQGHRRPQAV